MRNDKRRSPRLMWTWLVVWCLQYQLCSGSSRIVWTAFVELRYPVPGTNQSKVRECECGLYGSDSPLESASGFVALPKSDPLACQPNITFSVTQEPWIALIKRGNCSFTRKIQAAQQEGASAVVIYNLDGRGNGTNSMPHPGTNATVAIMITNILGHEIADLVDGGTEVYLSIEVGNPRGLWLNAFWVYVTSFVFFGITAIILGYFIFVLIKRIYRNRQHRIQQREIKRVAEKAIAKLQVRTLRRNDPEVDTVEVSCAVCIESFKKGEVVTQLPCSHLFHKACIEPWLLDHHTCPMCKYNILKGQVDVKETSSTPEVQFYPGPSTQTPEHPTITQMDPEYQDAPAVLQVSDVLYEVETERKDQSCFTNDAFEEERGDVDAEQHRT